MKKFLFAIAFYAVVSNLTPKPASAEESLRVRGIPQQNQHFKGDINGYVHNWIEFPRIEGIDVRTGGPVVYDAQKDFATVVYFIASHDLGSQNLIQRFTNIQTQFENLNTNFVYVFFTDLRAEAAAFAKEHGVKGTLILGDEKTKRAFQYPPRHLPLIYVGDRKGWIATRFDGADRADLIKLEEFLKLITAL